MVERDLGTIVRLQVQRDPLKTKGEGYDPSPLLSVPEASIDPLGMIGRHEDYWVLDAHHSAHPRARGGGNRALSIGFAGHYAAMAERFGAAELGIAGENIILDTPGRVASADLEGTLIIATADGEVALHSRGVAAPCAEFTSFIKGLDIVVGKRDQPDDVEFLDGGTRGFILDASGLDDPVLIRVGDRVSIRS